MKIRILCLISFLSFATVSLFVTSCDDDDDLPGEKITYNISGAASGAQQVPAVTTTATGSISSIIIKIQMC